VNLLDPDRRSSVVAIARTRSIGAPRSIPALVAVVLVAAAALLVPSDAEAQTAPSVNGRVVFASDADGDWDIWTMNADGTDRVKLTNDGTEGPHDAQPTWSPDGTRIVFQSTRGPGEDGDVYVMNADGGNVQRVTSNAHPEYSPDWSPDGSRIVFGSIRDGETPNDADDGDIYVIGADGSGERNVTDAFEAQPGQFQWFDKDPDWSPVADVIAFSSARVVAASASDGAFYRIVTMRPDGSNQTVVSDPNDPGNDPFPDSSPNHDEMPKWSLDGRWIAFGTHQQPEQQWDVQIVRANGTDQQNVLPDEQWEDLWPTWSPSGTEILFTSNRTGDHTRAIYSVDVSAFVTTQTSAAASQSFAMTTTATTAAATAVEPVGGIGRSEHPDVFGRLPCTISGTAGGETIDGTGLRDVICAGGGNDIVRSSGGRDVVYAGGGNDDVAGGLQGDILFGNAGTDRLNGGGGFDLCTDGPGTIRTRCE